MDRIHLICRRLVRNQFTQVPPSAPGAILHCKPLQQSAFVVHAAADGMQDVAAHRRMLPASGTHGAALQQSAEYAQTWPADMQVALPLKQRFTPPRPAPQIPLLPGLPQQSVLAPPPHKSPSGLQPVGLEHKPSAGFVPAMILQMTLPSVPPQHVASAVQSSWTR